jgi:hypothetical protein
VSSLGSSASSTRRPSEIVALEREKRCGGESHQEFVTSIEAPCAARTVACGWRREGFTGRCRDGMSMASAIGEQRRSNLPDC